MVGVHDEIEEIEEIEVVDISIEELLKWTWLNVWVFLLHIADHHEPNVSLSYLQWVLDRILKK